jgi:hypothetical protein
MQMSAKRIYSPKTENNRHRLTEVSRTNQRRSVTQATSRTAGKRTRHGMKAAHPHILPQRQTTCDYPRPTTNIYALERHMCVSTQLLPHLSQQTFNAGSLNHEAATFWSSAGSFGSGLCCSWTVAGALYQECYYVGLVGYVSGHASDLDDGGDGGQGAEGL